MPALRNMKALFLLLACLSASLGLPGRAEAGDSHVYRYREPSGTVHTLKLPSSLEPDRGHRLIFLDSTLRLDTMGVEEFSGLDWLGQVRMKYGRRLYLSQAHAEARYDLAPEAFRAKAAGDTLFHMRMAKAQQARKERMLWATGSVAAGLVAGQFLLKFVRATTCEVDPASGAEICDDGPEISKSRSMLGWGAVATGFAVGGILFTFEFDEEKVARRLAGKP